MSPNCCRLFLEKNDGIENGDLLLSTADSGKGDQAPLSTNFSDLPIWTIKSHKFTLSPIMSTDENSNNNE